MSHWKTLESKELLKLGLFQIKQDKCQLPDGRIMPKYYVVDFPNWVHVVPVTADGQMVLVDQYRYAAKMQCIELPGGTSEPHNGEEDKAAALRELEEETGYTGELTYIGQYSPNPALQSNLVQVYISFDCVKFGEQSLDPYEVIDVCLIPVKKVYEMVEAGQIQHGLILASLLLAKPHLKKFL